MDFRRASVQQLAVRIRVHDDAGEIDDDHRGVDPIEQMGGERGERREQTKAQGPAWHELTIARRQCLRRSRARAGAEALRGYPAW